jgi:hypothetical protein
MQKNIVITPPFAQSLKTGVVYAQFTGNHCTVHYSDGTTETARITALLREQVRAYYRYQAENGPEAEEPSFFEVISQVQSARV